jgi:hypothetical protein
MSSTLALAGHGVNVARQGVMPGSRRTLPDLQIIRDTDVMPGSRNRDA